MSKSNITAAGHSLWSKMPKANTELFALTYGSLITELLKDYDQDINEINNQLDRIGYSIGVRCIDELLAKCEVNGIDIGPCNSLENTAEVIAKVGFRCFLGMTCDVTNVTDKAFSLFLFENPLSIFVELPENSPVDENSTVFGSSSGAAADESTMGGVSRAKRPDWSQLKYSNIYCGVIRGALEQVNLKVTCNFVRDVLRGDDVNEIRVELKEIMTEGAGEDYQDE